jgi:hypothetical protein
MISALNAGESLKNPVFWKRIQVLAAGFIPVIHYIYPNLDKGLGGVVDSVFVAIIAYLTVATTDKLGVR